MEQAQSNFGGKYERLGIARVGETSVAEMNSALTSYRAIVDVTIIGHANASLIAAGSAQVRFCEEPGTNSRMAEIAWHRRETRRQ
jgi:hypothetical protein